MRTHLLLALLLATSFVSAQNITGLPPTLFPSVVVPANPNTNDEIFLDIRAERCIAFSAPQLDFAPVVSNGIIIVQIPGTVSFETMFCFPDRFSGRLALGRFPAGSYTIELRLRPGFFPITEPGLVVQRTPLIVGPVPFTVTQVPGTQRVGLVALALGLVLMGSVFVRRVG